MTIIKPMALALLLVAGAAQAVEVGGVRLPDEAKVDGQSLVLNGAGVRSKFFVKVYAGALYLPAKAGTTAAVLGQKGAKRILMRFIHDEVEKTRLVEAWNDGFAGNNSAAELARLRERIATFNSFFDTMRQGEEIVLDLKADGSTQVTVKGQLKGTIPGADFQAALLKIWLGDKPADSGLKKGMLGQ
ncbi:MAG TPA: chalcone isomerase family protein [Candidatus Competibacteraceae bacterium]|nr:chalcone isomerase family protein [Candidatus Competibacteraceae bacterium]